MFIKIPYISYGNSDKKNLFKLYKLENNLFRIDTISPRYSERFFKWIRYQFVAPELIISGI